MLDEAHVAALATMTMHARCVGEAVTDPACGFVNEDVARDLCAFGFARADEGQGGVAVFLITSAGFAALEAQTPKGTDTDDDPDRPEGSS